MDDANQTILAEKIKSALTTTEFAVRGARSCLFTLVSGVGNYVADDLAQNVKAPCMIWTPAKQSARLTLDAGTRGFVLRIPEKYIGRAIPTGTISAHVRQAVTDRIIAPGVPASHLAKLESLFGQIESELFDLAPGALSVVQHCISLLLIEIWRASGPAHSDPDALPHRIVQDFLHQVELHLQSHWTVSQYAELIGVSKDRLNSAVRRAIGMSPHRHIQARLVEESKTLLLHSNLQVAQIAYELGFSDAAYFNRYFQRHMNIAPGRYRRSNRRYEEEEESFAAWP